MRIGFDMTFAGTSKYGVGVHAGNLMRGMPKLDPEIAIRAFHGPAWLRDQGSNGQSRGRSGRLARLLRETFGTQVWLQEVPGDGEILVEPSHLQGPTLRWLFGASLRACAGTCERRL